MNNNREIYVTSTWNNCGCTSGYIRNDEDDFKFANCVAYGMKNLR